MLKYILFDFDGTLVESKPVFLKAYNTMAQRHGFQPIEAENIEALKRLSLMDRLRFLKVPFYTLPFLTREFLGLYEAEAASLSLIDGMEQIIDKLISRGLEVGIVSSNSAATIKRFLTANNITGIADVYCSSKLFGKDRVLRRFLKDKKAKGAEALYVCDELRDIEACHKVAIEAVWVSWGFETAEAVKSGNEVGMADSPEELLILIEEYHNRKAMS